MQVSVALFGCTEADNVGGPDEESYSDENGISGGGHAAPTTVVRLPRSLTERELA